MPILQLSRGVALPQYPRAAHAFLTRAVIAGIGPLLFISGCRQHPAARKQRYLESGLSYQAQGKLPEAIIEFSNALQIDSNFPDAHLALGEAQIARGDTVTGLHELQRTVQLSPSNVRAHTDLGLALLDAGEAIERPMEQYKAATAIAPNSPDVCNLLARIELTQGNRDKARSDAERAISLDPSRSSFHTTLGFIAAASPNGRIEAKQELERAIALDPRNTSAHLLLSDLLQKDGDNSGAVTHDLAAITSSPLSLKPRVTLAQLYLHLGDRSNAEHTLYQTAEELHGNEEAVALLGDFYRQSGQLPRAESAYAALAAKYPGSQPIESEYARTLIGNGKYDQAEKIVAVQSDANGNQPHLEALKALILIHAGKTDEALTLLQQAVKETPENIDLLRLLARTTAVKGNLTLAEVYYDDVIKRVPGDAEALTGLAGIAERRQDHMLLGKVAGEALQACPHFPMAHLWRGEAEVQGTLYAPAEADFREALRENPKDAEAYRALGQLKLAEGRVPEGTALLERSFAEDPGSMQTLSLLNQQDIRESHKDKAIARVEQLVAASPNNPRLYVIVASLHLSARNYAEARDAARRAIELNSSDVNALQIYTRAEISLNDAGAAILNWNQWLQSRPNDTRAMTVLGMLQEAKGDPGSAMEAYKKALARDPNQALAANNLAYLLAGQGQDLHTAFLLAQTARRILPDSPNTGDTLGWVYYQQQNYTSARDVLEEACKANPKDASIQYHLGLTYVRLNDKLKASTHLRNAVSAAGGGTQTAKEAKLALEKL